MGIADVVLNSRPDRPLNKKKYSEGDVYLLRALLNLLLYVGKSKTPDGVDGKLFWMSSEIQNSISDVSPMT